MSPTLLLLLLDADPALLAEQRRITDELTRLAGRNRWDGVERAYQELIGLGVAIPAEVHWLGAQAARDSGDVGEMRRRLEACGSADARDWLSQIDAEYAQVELHTDPPTPGVTFRAAGIELRPDRRAATRFAEDAVRTTGAFSGWLPVGDYHFAGVDFTLEPGETVALTQSMAWGGKKKR